MRQSPRYIFHDNTPRDAVCGTCGHTRAEHRDTLPAPCIHGRTDPMEIDPRQPGYGCACIGFTPAKDRAE
jgi:hypothetical protein